MWGVGRTEFVTIVVNTGFSAKRAEKLHETWLIPRSWRPRTRRFMNGCWNVTPV